MFNWIDYWASGIGHRPSEIKFCFYPFDGSISFSVNWDQWKTYSTNTCIGFGSCHSINGMRTVHFAMSSFIYIHVHCACILFLYLFLGRIHCSGYIICSLNLTIIIANKMPHFMYQYMCMFIYGIWNIIAEALCIAVCFRFSTQIKFIRLFRCDHLFSIFCSRTEHWNIFFRSDPKNVYCLSNRWHNNGIQCIHIHIPNVILSNRKR